MYDDLYDRDPDYTDGWRRLPPSPYGRCSVIRCYACLEEDDGTNRRDERLYEQRQEGGFGYIICSKHANQRGCPRELMTFVGWGGCFV